MMIQKMNRLQAQQQAKTCYNCMVFIKSNEIKQAKNNDSSVPFEWLSHLLTYELKWWQIMVWISDKDWPILRAFLEFKNFSPNF